MSPDTTADVIQDNAHNHVGIAFWPFRNNATNGEKRYTLHNMCILYPHGYSKRSVCKMNLRQQIIQDKTDALADLLGISPSDAFMRLTHSLVVGQSVHSFDMNDVVDGGQDKQIDVISIIDEGERADVYIIQAKNTTSFSSNALIQLHNGLRWIFQTPRKDLDTLANRSFHDKIVEYRALQSNMGPSNIQIHVRFITNGLTGELSDEFKQELKSIRDGCNSHIDDRLFTCVRSRQ